MSKSYYTLGLMSGTSADGVDASIIQSDGDTDYKVISDKYFEYNHDIYENIHSLKEEINDSRDLKKLSKKIQPLERKITLFHAYAVEEIIKISKTNIDLIGFHGQTIFHNDKEKISKQIGDGNLLSSLTKRTVAYNFRQNDLKNGGNGAPLTPIFHKLLKKKFKINNVTFVNIGGISNITSLSNDNYMSGTDVGPGMCLIDRWLREKSKKKYDEKGKIARSGEINKLVLNQLLDNFREKEKNIGSGLIKSYDTKYFNTSFLKNLSLEEGVATLTEFTVQLITSALNKNNGKDKIILCGGGRKNNFLVEKLKEKIENIKLIDEYGINGDFVESQAFAYIAIRSYLKLPISFPETTGVKKPLTGGVIVKN